MSSENLTLDFLCDAIIDCEHKTAPVVDEGIPSIRTTDIRGGVIDFKGANKISEDTYKEWTKRREPKEGDLIFCREAPVGEVGRLRKGDRVALGQRTVLLCPDKQKVDPRYLHYLLMGYELQYLMEGWSTGSTVAHLNVADIRKLPIPKIHNLKDQKFIGGLLDRIDILRQKLSEINTNTEQSISAIFRSWFIDFDPVKAKSEGKLPYGMDEETMAMFPDSFEDSELGPIPTGWTLTRMGDFADLTKGLSYKGAFLEETNDEGKKMMNLGCFGIDGSFRRNKIKYYSGEHKERHLLKCGDLLIANTDMTQDRVILGACIIIPSEYEGALFTHHTTRLRVHQNLDTRLNSLIAYQLSQPTFRHIAEGYSTGSTVLALPKDAILNYKIAMPPKELLDKFFSIDEDFFMQSQTLISTMKYLRNTREALLPKLMSGELSVS